MELHALIDGQIKLREQIETEILTAIKDREEQDEHKIRLQLAEVMASGAQLRNQDRTAARDLAVGAEEAKREAANPPTVVRGRTGQSVPVKVYQVRRDGSVVFELNGRYYLAPGTAVQNGEVQGRATKIIDAVHVQKVG